MEQHVAVAAVVDSTTASPPPNSPLTMQLDNMGRQAVISERQQQEGDEAGDADLHREMVVTPGMGHGEEGEDVPVRSAPSLLSSGLVLTRQVCRQCAVGAFVYLLGYLKLDPRWLFLFATVAAVAVLILAEVRGRRKAAAVEAAAAEAAVETSPETQSPSSSSSSLSYDDLPAWVVDPGAQRAEWVNALLRQLWPSLEEALGRILEVTERDDELLGRLGLRSLRFPAGTLGRSVPRLTGVKLHRWPGGMAGTRKEVVADLSLRYDGDARVALEAVPKVPLLPLKMVPAVTAAVMNVSFKGTIR